jgi:hypothetical protein
LARGRAGGPINLAFTYLDGDGDGGIYFLGSSISSKEKIGEFERNSDKNII